MTIAITKVNFGLVHNIRLDLSVLLIGSTSSDNGYSLRRGFQLTYLFGENSENRVFFPFFLNVDQALSQSVDDVSPLSLPPPFSGDPREQRGASASGGRRAKNLPEPSRVSMPECLVPFKLPFFYPRLRGEERRGEGMGSGWGEAEACGL